MARASAAGAEHRGIGAEPHRAAEIAALPCAARFRCRAPTRSAGRRPACRTGRTRSMTPPASRPDCGPFRSPPSAFRSRCRGTARSRSRAKRTAAILPSLPRSPKPPGTRMPCTSSSRCDRVDLLEHLAVHPVQPHPHPVRDAAMRQRLGQRFVAVEQVRVLADDRDAHLAFRRADRIDDALPARRGRAPSRRAGRNGAAPRGPCLRRGS